MHKKREPKLPETADGSQRSFSALELERSLALIAIFVALYLNVHGCSLSLRIKACTQNSCSKFIVEAGVNGTAGPGYRDAPGNPCATHGLPLAGIGAAKG